ncbi:MAG: hypothetical protein LBD80_05850 [Tannerella sp.]|jgi:hypothetical protein|nr:hypothetical protein [Tannerella sp.]
MKKTKADAILLSFSFIMAVIATKRDLTMERKQKVENKFYFINVSNSTANSLDSIRMSSM